MGLSPADLETVRKLIYEEAGLVFETGRGDLMEARIARRMAEFPGLSSTDYTRRLYTDRQGELRHLIDLLTINESYFHRDLPQLRHFAEHLLRPRLQEMAGRPMSRLRIWSAGCSIGCEPYTLAMLITEELERLEAQVEWQIVATDISLTALQVAKEALYTERELKDVPPAMRARFFQSNGEFYEYAHPSRQRVQFQYSNLMQPCKAVQGPFDFVFCRNVLIYFDDRSRRAVADTFFDALARGGAVFLGSAESMGRISRAFELKRVGPGLVYVKE